MTRTRTRASYDAMRETVAQLHALLIETAREEFVAGTKVKWQVCSPHTPDGCLRGVVLPHKESLARSCLIAIERTDSTLKKAPIAFIDAYNLEVDTGATGDGSPTA